MATRITRWRRTMTSGILKPWIAALSLGATVGGWAFLAQREAKGNADEYIGSVAATLAQGAAPVVQSVVATLPPVPSVAALAAYATPGLVNVPALDLPEIPVVSAPAPRVQAQPQAQPQPQPQPAPPVTTTRSSK